MNPSTATATVAALRPLRRARVGAWLLVAGCVIGGDKYPRPRDLSPAWLVDRPRVLAVVAEPPEIRPGQRASFSAVVPTPGDTSTWVKIWLACPVDDGGIGFGCVTDFSALDLETATPEQLAELGFVGIEPGLPPAYVAPVDLLDGLDPEERAEGRYVNVQVTALPEAVVDDPDALAELDFNAIEAAYNRLVVSEAATPNHHPQFDRFLVDRLVVPVGVAVEVDAGQTYDLGVTLRDGAREQYQFINADGVVEERVEEPYVTWYTTDGEMLESYTLYPYLEASWTAPEAGGTTGTWYAVLRDRRGGQAVFEQAFVVR